MLDIKLFREDKERVIKGITDKGFTTLLPVIQQIEEDDSALRIQQTELEGLRSEQKQLNYQDETQMAHAKVLKEKINGLEATVETYREQLNKNLLLIPNLPDPTVPVGEGESANHPVRTHGNIPNIENPVDHVTLNEKLDLFDTERGAKVAGARFNYLRNQAVLLEFGLIRFGLDIVMKHGFSPMITPELVNGKTVTGTGYLPHGEDEVYKTQDDLYLIGTSELALVAYHQDEILPADDLPVRYAGFSSCFRREAGSYGKDTRGIIRQHQFDKLEMVSFVKPEDSAAELDKILAIEEEIMQTLGLPYQVLEIGTGDLGIQAAKKYDIETWMPGQQKYRETHSCSNTTDFQTRRLNIRYKNAEEGKNEFVHSLNGTAIAIGRMLVAILENGQQLDGSVVIPTALIPYVGFDRINPSR